MGFLNMGELNEETNIFIRFTSVTRSNLIERFIIHIIINACQIVFIKQIVLKGVEIRCIWYTNNIVYYTCNSRIPNYKKKKLNRTVTPKEAHLLLATTLCVQTSEDVW